jgi:chromosome segregation ATPase
MVSRANLTIALAVFALFGAAACESSPKYDQAITASTSITTLRAQLTSAKESLNTTMQALSDLEQNPGQDLRPQYQRFVTDLGTLETQAEDVKSHARDMRNKAEQYFSAWNEQAQKIQDEQLRAKSTERRDQTLSIFSKLTDASQKLASEWNPFLAHVKDVKKYLDTDLSPGALAAAKDTINTTIADSKKVSAAVDGVIAELDTVSNTLSAGKVAPPPQQPAPQQPAQQPVQNP